MNNKAKVNRLAIQYCFLKDKEPDKAKAIAEEIIQIQAPLVKHLSRRISSKPRFDADIVSAVREGIFLSLQYFDTSRGVKFTTYSYDYTFLYAKSQFKRIIHKTDKKGRADILYAYYNWKSHHLEEDDRIFANTFKVRSMTPDGILKHINCRMLNIRKEHRFEASNEGVDQSLSKREIIASIHELPEKAKLSEKETVILWRFLSGEKLKTIAEDFPFSKQYCQQVESRAIRKIKTFLESHPDEKAKYKELMD